MIIFYNSCTQTVSELFSSSSPLIKEFTGLFLNINTQALFLRWSCTEGDGRQGRKSEQLTSAEHYVPLHCFDLTGKNQGIMQLTIDLTLFPMVMDSVDIGPKLKSYDIEEKSMTHSHEA